MNFKIISIFNTNNSVSIRKHLCFSLLFIWTLTTSQQCNNTISDACGNYTTKPGVVKVILTLNTIIPTGRPRPLTLSINGVDNVVNIQGSLFAANPTMLGLKSETYALCNGVPRFRSTCCMSNTNSCLTVEDQTPYQAIVLYQGAFKSKITVRAISLTANYSAYDLYEGSFDIDATLGTPSLLAYCNLSYKKTYNSANIPASYLCDYNENNL